MYESKHVLHCISTCRYLYVHVGTCMYVMKKQSHSWIDWCQDVVASYEYMHKAISDDISACADLFVHVKCNWGVRCNYAMAWNSFTDQHLCTTWIPEDPKFPERIKQECDICRGYEETGRYCCTQQDGWGKRTLSQLKGMTGTAAASKKGPGRKGRKLRKEIRKCWHSARVWKVFIFVPAIQVFHNIYAEARIHTCTVVHAC